MAQFAIRVSAVRERVKARQIFSWQDLLILMACKTGSQKVASLAAEIGAPKPAITRAIDALEQQAPKPLLRRRVDTDDKRSPWIELTPAGLKFVESLLVELPD